MLKRNRLDTFLKFIWLIATVVCVSYSAHAKKPIANKKKTLKSSDIFKHVSSQYSFENYFSASTTDLRTNDFNTGNRLSRTPTQSLDLDLRGDFKFEINNNLKIKIRPRALVNHKKINLESPNETINSTTSKIDLTDAFWEETINSKWSYTAGLQVYQWGPAEFSNPSNTFFHFNLYQKSFFYKEKGKVLARINSQWNDNLSSTLLVEPISNNESLWREYQDFKPQAMIKTDWQITSQNYLGLIAGQNDEGNLYIGEYFNHYLTDSASLYWDARHEMGSVAYQPKHNILGYDEMLQDRDNKNWFTVATLGARYESDNWDFRIEYFYNQPGYSKADYEQALGSTHQLSPVIVQNIKRFAKPGLELYGKQYLYSSIRMTDFLKYKELTAFLKYVHSLQDSSGIAIADLEKNISDSWTGYFEYNYFVGKNDNELSLQQFWQVYAGARLSL